MPERVHSRRQFARFAQSSKRGRSGPFRIQYVEPSESPQEFGVAYAITKAVGNAVVRNRIRRRLRATVDQIQPRMAPGLYLIKCDFNAKDLPYERFRDHVEAALADAGTLR